jgi:uncharacterized membrane protein
MDNGSPLGSRAGRDARKSCANRGRFILPTGLILAVAMLCVPVGVSADKKYDHPLIEQTYRLLPDGTAEVEEIRTFRFRGTFSFAFIERELQGDYGRYGIEYIGVWDADSGEKLRYETSSGPGTARIKWFYTASHETRRFTVRYRIENAVQRYVDVAQFHWKGIEEHHAPLKKVHIRIIPPSPSVDPFKVFVHGEARPGTLDFADDFSEAVVTQSSIPRRSFVELRVLLDPDIFGEMRIRTDQTYETILADERRIARAETRRVRLMTAAVIGAVAAIALFIGAYIWLYVRYGREPRIAYDALYEREPPRDIPPSVVPAILTQSKASVSEMPKGFAATLLECARLGYLELHEKTNEGFLGTGLFKGSTFVYTITHKGRNVLLDKPVDLRDDERRLTAFEVDVIKVVFNEAGDGNTVTSKEIEEWGKKTVGKETNFLRFIEPRAKLLRKLFEKEHFELDDQRSERAKVWFMGLSIAFGVFFILLFILAVRTPVIMIIGVAIIFIGIIAAMPLARRTPEAALEYERWQAFKRFMSDFSAMKEAGPSLLPLWERYLVYAAALGVADKLLDNLKLVAREYSHQVPVAVWYHPIAAGSVGGALGHGFSSLESLSNSFTNFSNLSSALSSSTGTGGGFSGGGGSGGGGGSSGAG